MKLSPEKQKAFALTFLIVLACVGATWYFLIQGLQKNNRVNDAKLKRLDGEIAQLKKEISTEESNRAQAKSFQLFIQQYEEQMPKGNAETWLVKKLTDMALKHNISISNTNVQLVKELSEHKFGGKNYELIGFRFEFEAEFNKIGKFIEDLENSMPLLEVDELTITAGSNKAPHIHTVSMRISMVTKI
jgi:Tfp pilus assembly protein PilO